MTVNNFSKRISYLYELIVNKVTKTVSFEKKKKIIIQRILFSYRTKFQLKLKEY